MWVLVVLALPSAMAVWLLPAAHAPRLSLRERGKALADPRVLGILAGTVTVLTPVFVVIAYLPAIMRTSGAWIVVTMLAYGAGQVTSTILVPRLIRRRSSRTALRTRRLRHHRRHGDPHRHPHPRRHRSRHHGRARLLRRA